jgi:hypothetical protein
MIQAASRLLAAWVPSSRESSASWVCSLGEKIAMETAAPFHIRDSQAMPNAVVPSAPDRGRTLRVTATYLLSEEGRKASLLSGGDGCAVQEITLTVPAERLHLVNVDAKGVARLKLRPRFELDGEQRVVFTDSPPTYDVPPTMEDLLHDAARNHQLERAYHAQRIAERAKQREGEFDLRAEAAREFLADPTRRAADRPKPTASHCFLILPGGRRLRFDVSVDSGLAREVPAEAYRRLQRDRQADRERRRQQWSTDIAVHEDKKCFIAAWVVEHGTADQKARHAAGVLPAEEVISAIADQAFALLGDRPRYVGIDHAQLQTHVRNHPKHRKAVLFSSDAAVTVTNAASVTARQWKVVEEIKQIVPDAEIVIRSHVVGWKGDPNVPALTASGVRVTRKIGPFIVKREYTVPDD